MTAETLTITKVGFKSLKVVNKCYRRGKKCFIEADKWIIVIWSKEKRNRVQDRFDLQPERFLKLLKLKLYGCKFGLEFLFFRKVSEKYPNN